MHAEEIVTLAREYATTRPAVIRLNYGVQRSERGAMAVRTIALLPALTGSWKDLGGGLQLSTSQAFHLNRAGLERADLQQQVLGREARLVNMSELGAALTTLSDPPVKAMVVYNSNPAAIAPNQNAVMKGLKARRSFHRGARSSSRTTQPTTPIFCCPRPRFSSTPICISLTAIYYLQLARPALPAPGKAKSNVAVFRLLAERMGFTEACFLDSDDDMIRTLLDSAHPFIKGITIENWIAMASSA